jgi:hypothetical protein
MGLHDDGKTGGTLNSWGQYAKSGDIIFDVAGGGLGGSVVGKVKLFSTDALNMLSSSGFIKILLPVFGL